MINVLRDRIATYIRTHKAETRLLCFIFAFALVWSQADNINDFFAGFFSGVENARQH